MSYIVRLRRVSDGKEVDVVWPFSWEEGSLFYWTGGNNGCDCNREAAFETALGREHHAEDFWCSEGRFDLVSIHVDGHKMPLPEGTR